MRSLFKNILSNYINLFLISNFIVRGLQIKGGFEGYTKSVLILSVVFPLLKPILKIVLIPINFLTLGLFNFLLSAILIYLLTLIVPEFSISPSIFMGFQLGRYVSIVLVAILLYLLNRIFRWLIG